MDTSKNTQHKASNNSYSGKNVTSNVNTNNNTNANNNNTNTNNNTINGNTGNSKKQISSPPSSVSNLVPSSSNNIESGKDI